ncbi:MAG: hypothetical protein KJN93_05540, partial [Alphaproteobacteria bacterium]|nr:hypothetical protein [Alphaproteobacteria bacterium]
VLADAQCQRCGVTASQLMLKGEILEICAEEFASDIESGERILVPLGLCPTCHKKHHLDARGHHNPCQIKARRSREGLE